MTTKNLIVLAGVAVVLGGAAWYLKGGSKPQTPKLNGKAVLAGLDVSAVAKIEVGEKLKLSAAEDGWKIDTLHGYPADRDKIAENLMKLAELKVGQVARGRKLGESVTLKLTDGAGKELAALPLGDKHLGKATGQMAMYGGGSYPDGRYVGFAGETVLVRDTLDAFDGDAKKWCKTRIAEIPSADVVKVTFADGKEKTELVKDTNGVWTVIGLTDKEELDSSKTYSLDSALSYLDFNDVADPALTEADLGFATGVVYTVTVKSGTNRVEHVAKIGNSVKGGDDRYFRLDDGKWVYVISSYAAGNMMKKRSDLVKAKEEPKKEEPKK